MARTVVALLVLLALGGALGERQNFRQQTNTRLTNLESNSSSLTENQRALQAKVSELENRLATVQARAMKRAAIRAVLTTDRFLLGQPVPLQVVQEIGGGYDASTSKYTAPYSGWYTVDVQLFPKNTIRINVDLHVGSHTARAACQNNLDTNRIVSSTCHVGMSMHVQAGEKLWMSTNSPGPYYTAPFDNFFTAVLVIPDD